MRTHLGPGERRLPLFPSALLALAVVVALVAGAGAGAGAAMKSKRLPDGTCATTGGGKIVDIPHFPGERVDRRLLRDIRRLEKRYKIFVTDGYSTSDVHAANGEHPLGLALDIVPNKAKGGTWADISALARWAEPRQDQPRAPFRWVGYNGDAGHGRGHHLHLSWSHSLTKPGRIARTVLTDRCPTKKKRGAQGGNPPAGGTSAGDPPPATGGTTNGPASGDDGEASGGSGSGGIRAKPRIAPPVDETGGVERR